MPRPATQHAGEADVAWLRGNLWILVVPSSAPLPDVTRHAQAATGETLPWFPTDEVAALLDRSDVMDSEELTKDVRRLFDRAREHEEINDG